MVVPVNATIILIPQDYPTIQQGIYAAIESDTVLVQPGAYVGDINFSGKDIMVASYFLTYQDSNYIEQTLIIGTGDGSVVAFENEETNEAKLIGFTITGGSGNGNKGGGIYCFYSDPTLQNLIVSQNHIENLNGDGQGGGGIYLENSSAILTDMTIKENTVSDNSGFVCVGGGICIVQSQNASLNNLTIQDNSVTASGDYGLGGGVYLYSSINVIFNNSTIQGNSINSYDTGEGGGICVYQSDNITLENLIIQYNIISSSNQNSWGGGISISLSDYITLEDLIIEGNNINANDNSTGGGVFVSSSDYITMEKLIITNNTALGDSPNGGGGVNMWNSSCTMNAIEITGNYGLNSLKSDGIYISGGALSLTNVTISNNHDDIDGVGIYNNGATVSINSSIVWDNNIELENNTSNLNVLYCDIEGGLEGIINDNDAYISWLGVNINANPLFIDTEGGDYHLTGLSPCIDAGSPYLPLDPDGTIADMGAYYYHQVEEPPLYAIIVDHQSGWNLVGLPLDVEDLNYLTIFPDAIENTLFSFDDAYMIDTTLIQGEGYWLRFDSSGTTTIIGHPINELVISLSEGWNLVSGLHYDLSVYSINDPDSTIVPNTLFGFSDAYFPTEELVPGKGYWIRAFQDGDVTISGSGLARISSQEFSLNDKANTLTVNGMDLYFGVEILGRERLSYSLPPKPPTGAFDVRFKGDTRVTKEKAEIEVMSTSETITIAYNVVINAGEYMNWVLTSENGKDYILEGTGEITVPSAETFVLNRVPVIPITFALHQNFPNPFNPITTLRYDLPSDALVTLSIYDMLGREITQLVNTHQQAGFKAVQWDATDSMGRAVSAGVYLYKIQAGEFVQTKKMVLLK